jgi:hypothetical protein
MQVASLFFLFFFRKISALVLKGFPVLYSAIYTSLDAVTASSELSCFPDCESDTKMRGAL